MKYLFIGLFLVFNGVVFSQQWKDSLKLARQLYREGAYEEAMKKYEHTQNITPKHIDLSDEMGQTAYKAEQLEKAEKHYNASSSNRGSNSDKGRTQRNLGLVKMKQKRYDEAIESFKDALRHNPNDEAARKNLTEAKNKKKQQQNQQNQQNKGNKGSDRQDPTTPRQENEKQQNQEQQNGKPSSNSKQQAQKKLEDKNTERALDELVKKEMETKKKLGAGKGQHVQTKSGKDW